MKDWWTYWPAIQYEPEYSSYVGSVTKETSNDHPETLKAASVAVIASNDTENLGLNNFYNTGRLVNAFASNDQAKLELFTRTIGYSAVDFIEVMRYHVQAVTMGGALRTYTAQELINGYENDIAARVNGGQYYGGYDFSIANATTPVFNELIGTVSD